MSGVAEFEKELKRREQFSAKLAYLAHSDRDTSAAFYEQPTSEKWDATFKDMTFFRLTRHSKFWKEESTLLHEAITNLVSALRPICIGWTFVLIGTGQDIECWFGAKLTNSGNDREHLTGLFRSGLRSIGVADGQSRPDLKLHSPPMVFVSGAPGIPQPKSTLVATDLLCRGLGGATWRYIVDAKPVPDSDMLDWLHCFERAKASGTRDPLENAYLKAIEALRQRAEEGVRSGAWDVDVWFSSPSPEILQRGRALLKSALSGTGSEPDPIRVTPCSSQRTINYPWWLSSRQLAALACPPAHKYPGYQIVDHTQFGVQTIPANSAGSNSVEIGEIWSDGMPTGNHIQIDLDELTNHALVVGVTGGGKTNTCFQLLAQLAERDIPYLVIESAKSEYRELLNDSRFARNRPQIFTVGNESVRPLRINPMEVPPGTLLQTHIDYVKQLFIAAFVLWPPLPQILEKSIEEIYKDRGWDLATGKNLRAGDHYKSARLFPTLDDLAKKCNEVVDRTDYSEDVKKDVRASLITRLDELRRTGGKGPMFNTRQSFPSEDFFDRPCILELESLVSDEEKAFLMGLLLVRLYEYHKDLRERDRLSAGAGRKQGELCHVTLIEEAHRLLRNVGSAKGSEIQDNRQGQAIEVFSNMLAEIRGYGEGIVMAEQIPEKLVPDAIKNTNLKIVHRLLAIDDRELMGKAMNLEPDQIGHLTRLQRGQAVVYAYGLLEPVLVKIPPSPVKRSLNVSDDQLKPQIEVGANASARKLLRDLSENDQHAYEDLILFLRLVYQDFLARDIRLDAIESHMTYLKDHISRSISEDIEVSIEIFVVLLDMEIESRSSKASHPWPFEKMDDVVESGRKFALALFLRADGNEISRAAHALHGKIEELYEQDSKPYNCCTRCQFPCRFRFDFQTSLSGREDFQDLLISRERFLDRETWPKLSNHARHVSRLAFSDANEDMLADTAYCFIAICAHHVLEMRDIRIKEDIKSYFPVALFGNYANVERLPN